MVMQTSVWFFIAFFTALFAGCLFVWNPLNRFSTLRAFFTPKCYHPSFWYVYRLITKSPPGLSTDFTFSCSSFLLDNNLFVVLVRPVAIIFYVLAPSLEKVSE